MFPSFYSPTGVSWSPRHVFSTIGQSLIAVSPPVAPSASQNFLGILSDLCLESTIKKPNVRDDSSLKLQEIHANLLYNANNKYMNPFISVWTTFSLLIISLTL